MKKIVLIPILMLFVVSFVSARTLNCATDISSCSGLVSLWPNDEGDPVSTIDDREGTNDCTGNGVPTSSTGQISGALFYDGGDYSDCGTSSSLRPDELTVFAWIKTTGSGTVVGKFADGSNGYNLQVEGSGVVTVRIGGASENLFSSTGTVDDGEWHSIGFTRTATPSPYLHTIYIDGVADGSSTINRPFGTNLPFRFGKYTFGGDFGFFTGDVDETIFFMNSPETIQIHQNGGNEGQCFQIHSANNYHCGSAPSLNVWHHIALVRDGNTVRYYIDGSQLATKDITGLSLNNPSVITMAQPGSGWVSYFAGYIDEFRISKGIARWTAPFTAPTSAYGASVTHNVSEANWVSGFDLFDYLGNLISGSTTKTTLELRRGGTKRVRFTINDTTNLSGVSVDHDGSRLVVSGLGSASGTTSTHSLYADNTGSGVYICPSATTISAVEPDCSGVVKYTHAECVAVTTTSGYTCRVDGTLYRVDGLTGSGLGEVCSSCSDCNESADLYCDLINATPTCQNRTLDNPPECVDCINNDPVEDSDIDFPADSGCTGFADLSEFVGGGEPAIPEFSTIGLILTLITVGLGVALIMRRRR